MTIHGWGTPLWTSEITAEFGDPGNRPIWLSQFYRGGARVPNISQNNAISMADYIAHSMFYGATNRAPPGSITIWSGQNFVVPVGHSVLHIKALAGGGGGQGGWGNYSNAGGAGAGGLAGSQWNGDIAVTSGETLYVEPGAGGQGGYGTLGGGYTAIDTGPIYDNTGPNGYGGQNGGNSRIHRYSNNSDILVVAGGLGGLKTNGHGNFANPQGYNPTNPSTYPIYDEFGTYLGEGTDPGSWHTGFAGIGAGVFDGINYSGGAGAVNYNVGGNGGLGSGGGGGAASNYSPNDYFTKGGDGGQGVIIISWG